MSPSRRVTLYSFSAGLDIGLRDDCSLVEAGLAARGVGLELVLLLKDPDQIDNDAAGREDLEMLEAEPRHVVLVDEFPHRVLVVVAVAAAEMAEAVQMRPDMALAEPRVLDEGRVVLAVGRPRRERSGGQDGLAKARAEQRDTIHQRMGQADHLAFLDLRRGGLYDGGCHSVGRTRLIVGSERRGRNGFGAVGLRIRPRAEPDQARGHQPSHQQLSHLFPPLLFVFRRDQGNASLREPRRLPHHRRFLTAS